ncbi:ABC transporter related protein [Pseudopedobacter saltans DSM 12145]|uniref:ABC transporter related protein n=1 Tax=Pseudopedobacter saltans (strain ATCC 51119 / DSM 12145 / JCM 21818 / CCUG 39354 / LMG 10337 / NBRC 100064 / NCIMB 13643) TaxID=762903 RepID=F0S7N1_PSESL|nr:ABC transporter ATP-binding protein [Pseudopedobacter saltans]ADY52291.1 ABC transporter related protein [Pseudopedobacter saltans DSM 12145]
MLDIQNIVKEYSKHRALDHVSLQIKRGQIFGLLGPNGAGKTSLIRIINQITAPDSGEILFDGEKLSSKHIEKIGYLPEERGLYKKMEIGEQVLYLAQLKGLNKTDAIKKIKYWFEKMGMQDWWDKKVEDLSKGMQQKVQFVATVMHEPELIILDEPFSGFDPLNADIIKKEILELNKQGATIIFSTHRMETVEELCDHIALINKSKKILDGSVRDIKNSYRNGTFKIQLEGDFGDLNPNTFSVIQKTLTADDFTELTIHLHEGYKVNDVLNELIPRVNIHYLNEVIPSINEIFIEKVSHLN